MSHERDRNRGEDTCRSQQRSTNLGHIQISMKANHRKKKCEFTFQLRRHRIKIASKKEGVGVRERESGIERIG